MLNQYLGRISTATSYYCSHIQFNHMPKWYLCAYFVSLWVWLTASVVHTCKGNWITCTLTVPQNLFECLRNENNMHGHKGYIKGIEVLESYIYLGNIFDLWKESVRTYTYLHLRIQVEELFPFRLLVYVTYTQFPQQSCSNYRTKRVRAMFLNMLNVVYYPKN